jgi:putative nucleotidyltransferase with HDIG domain
LSEKIQNIYILAVIAAGICFLARSIAICLDEFPFSLLLTRDWVLFAVLVVLMIACRMLPIYITSDKTMDISFVPVVAGVLLCSPELVMILYAVSCLPTAIRDQKTGKLYYPLFRTPKKELFNVCNILTSIGLASLAVEYIPVARAASIGWPQFLMAGLFALVLIIANLLLFIFYYVSGGDSSFTYLFVENVRGVAINVLCTLCIGTLIAIIQQYGYLMLLLFLVPLMMARYSFKLYLDSRTQTLRSITALSRAIDAKDPYTQNHSDRVAAICVEMARAMKKSRAFVEQMRLAALLHDVGKIGISDSVLQKPGPLDSEEYDQIKLHPVKGREIIENMQLPTVVTNAVLYHHRRFDGQGYPDAGPSHLPIEASILAVADTYDAMTSDRPYRAGMPHEKAVAIIRSVSGTQLDPEAVDAFLKIEPRIKKLAAAMRSEVR